MPATASVLSKPDDPYDPSDDANPLDLEGLTDPDAGLDGSSSGDFAELPLTSEPPLADASPLTSEPPLGTETPLTSEPTTTGAEHTEV